METTFTDEDRAFLERPAFAALALTLPNGALQNSNMWYRLEQDSLRMIAPAASAKARALRRSPRVAVLVSDPDNPYQYLEIRGHADVVADDSAARAELRAIAQRYIGERAAPYVESLSDAPRVVIVVMPERIRRHRSSPVPAGG